MKISLGLGIIIALIIVGGALWALNGYLQKDNNQIFLGAAGSFAGILFIVIGSLKKETKTESQNESVPEGGFEY